MAKSKTPLRGGAYAMGEKLERKKDNERTESKAEKAREMRAGKAKLKRK